MKSRCGGSQQQLTKCALLLGVAALTTIAISGGSCTWVVGGRQVPHSSNLAQEVATFKALRMLQEKTAQKGTTHTTAKHTAVEKEGSTAALSKSNLRRRFYMFVAIIIFAVTFLLLAGTIAQLKKNGQIAIGSLVFRRGAGFFWGESLLCWGPKSNEPSLADYDPLTAAAAPLESGAGLAGSEVAGLKEKHRISKDGEREADMEQFHKWEVAKVEKDLRYLTLRKGVLLVLFLLYVGTSVGIPFSARHTVTCAAGFFWETHMWFLAIFSATKMAELFLYTMDDTILGTLPFTDFMIKFMGSFFGYADGYMDCTAIMIAQSCPHPLAQTLAFWMACTYIGGVVVLQWVIVTVFAIQDPSQACVMKLIHMDALASCVSLPEDQKRTWNLIHLARTFGEDLPQAVLQTMYILYVKQNYFMMISVFMGLISSCKAVYDACFRGLVASGAYEKFQAESTKAAAREEADTTWSATLRNVMCTELSESNRVITITKQDPNGRENYGYWVVALCGTPCTAGLRSVTMRVQVQCQLGMAPPDITIWSEHLGTALISGVGLYGNGDVWRNDNKVEAVPFEEGDLVRMDYDAQKETLCWFRLVGELQGEQKIAEAKEVSPGMHFAISGHPGAQVEIVN